MMKIKDKDLEILVNSYFRFGLGTGLFVKLRSSFFHYFDLLERYLPKEGNIVDLGCGHGLFTNLVVLKSPLRKVVGVDPLKDRIESARWVAKVNNLKNVYFRQQWLEDFQLEGYKGITIIDVFCYLPFNKQEKLLKKCYRGLHPDGILIIKDVDRQPAWKYRLFYLEELLKVKFKIIFGSETWDRNFHKKFYARDSNEFQELLGKEKFVTEVIKLDQWNYQPHVAYICRKAQTALYFSDTS